MEDDKRFYQRPEFWPRLIGGGFLLAFVIAYWPEIRNVAGAIYAFLVLLVKFRLIEVSPDVPRSVLVLVANAMIFSLSYFLVLRWISVFLLPAHVAEDRKRVFNRLVNFIFQNRERAVFVKGGELIGRKEETTEGEEMDRHPIALALIDVNSAIVVEKQSRRSILKSRPPAKKPGGPEEMNIRVVGPGIGFLGRGERIRGVVDLRKQTRTIKGLQGYTSDGIGLLTNVHASFTLGQPPDVLMVVSVAKGPEGLRVLGVETENDSIASLSNGLDFDDREEINKYVNGHRPLGNAGSLQAWSRTDRPPFQLDEERIVAAVLSQPRNVKDGKLGKWSDLPAQVAATVLLEELTRISYDQLYSLDSPRDECYLFDKFKPAFSQKVKNKGILAYQYLVHKADQIPAVGQPWNPGDYLVWEIQTLHTSKPLRDRGIKLLEANFTDFKPLDSTIPEQRFENWRSQWQKKVELTNADYDLEVMRTRNHARAQAQREIVYNLSQIFKLPGSSQEAIALRIFEALEAAAANPATSRLLPGDTLDMLKNLQRLLFPEDRAVENPNPKDPGGS